MMGKTHLAVGTAAAFAVTMPDTYSGCLLAIIGGAVGGVLADIDILDNDNQGEGVGVHFMAVMITVLALSIDYVLKLGICDYFINCDKDMLIRAFAVWIGLCVFGIFSGHRKFTHSMIAMAAFTVTAKAIYQPVALPFLAGYASHIALDLLNRRKIRLLYPLGWGVCLNLCYAGKFANKMFLLVGSAGTVILLLTRAAAIWLG